MSYVNRKLIAPLALAASMSLPHAGAQENAVSPWTVKGSYRLRGENQFKPDGVNKKDLFGLRIRFDVTYSVSPTAKIFVQPQFTKVFGEPVYNGTSTTANAKQNTSGESYDTPINAHQAYLDYGVNSWLNVVAGRQVLSYGDEFILAKGDWNHTGRSFDGLKAVSKHAWGSSDLFAMKLVDLNTKSSGAGDKNLYGFYNSFRFSEAVKEVDVYVLHLNDKSVAATSATTSPGIRVKSAVGGLDYGGEFVKQWQNGGADNSESSAYRAEVGYTWNSWSLAPRFAIERFYASENYNSMFPSTHRWHGIADVLGRANLEGGSLHLGLKPSSSTALQVDYHIFERSKAGFPVYKTNGASLTPTSGSRDNDVGSELDLVFKAEADSNNSVSVGGGYFWSGSYLKSQYPGIDPYFYYLQWETRF